MIGTPATLARAVKRRLETWASACLALMSAAAAPARSRDAFGFSAFAECGLLAVGEPKCHGHGQMVSSLPPRSAVVRCYEQMNGKSVLPVYNWNSRFCIAAGTAAVVLVVATVSDTSPTPVSTTVSDTAPTSVCADRSDVVLSARPAEPPHAASASTTRRTGVSRRMSLRRRWRLVGSARSASRPGQACEAKRSPHGRTWGGAGRSTRSGGRPLRPRRPVSRRSTSRVRMTNHANTDEPERADNGPLAHACQASSRLKPQRGVTRRQIRGSSR